MRRFVAVAICSALLASCGSSEVPLAEYIGQVEALTNVMYGQLDRVAAQVTSASVTVADIQAAYSLGAVAFREFSDGLQTLEPPPEIAATHAAALDMATNLALAGEAFSVRADSIGDEEELDQLFASPEARALQAAQEEIVTFCHARQAEFDATADREGLSDVPWIPSEMKEVVLVAFGCDRADPSENSP
jgi:hypothetical protein